MSDRYFVDTNILMYAHDLAAGEKHEKAKARLPDFVLGRPGGPSRPSCRAEILYFEDLSDRQSYGTVQVKNPVTGGDGKVGVPSAHDSA